MPKPLIHNNTQSQTGSVLSFGQKTEIKQNANQMSKMQLDRLLRNTRSKRYMDALHKLDAGGHVHNQAVVKEIIDAIREEFPEVELSGVLLGFVSICYLGEPYEVHTLDLSGQIIEHYVKGQPLPGGLEKARSIAMHGGYEFIEVYTDCCRCISSTGSVSVVK